MKTKNALIFCALVLIFVAAFSIKAYAVPAFCSNATLNGTYIYSSVGGPNSGELTLEAGIESYDGEGHIQNIYSVPGPPYTPGTATGTYHLNGNCTGTSTYNDGSEYAIYVSPNGSSFTFISIKGVGKATGTGTETRVSTSLIVQP